MSSYEEEEIEEGKILLEDFFPLWTDVCYSLLSGKAPAHPSLPLPHPAHIPNYNNIILQMQGCYGDLLMLQLPCGKWMSLSFPSGLRDYGQMLQE